jgi:malonyl-CoA/methylmalonyl-CoA synthetase
MSANLYSQFLSAMPDVARPFIRTSSGRVVSYGDVISLSGQMANALTEFGLMPGERVAVQVEKSPEALILYLACLRTGAVYLPLNAAYTLSELEYFVGDAEPKIFVASPARASKLNPMTSRLGVAATETLGTDGLSGTLMERARSASAEFSDVSANPDDLAAILYTSGTTGSSKGAMLSHANLGSNAESLKEIWRFTSDDVLLHALPIFHTHGLFVASNVILSAGASMIFLPKLDPDEVFRLLPDATTMMGVPTFYVRLLQDERLNIDATAHMRVFISGSAPLLEETHREWRTRTGHAILERYGMTETNMNTSNPYEGDRVPGSVGFPLPGVSLRVTDPESGAELPKGEIGMLEVKGPNVFSGYWRMEEKTKAEFRDDGYFITGDLVTIDERGYVHIVGRGKDLIISGGYNVYPKEVESEIDAYPGVVESAIIGVAHRDFGEGVTAVVVPRKGTDLSEKDIMAWLREKLANYKLPKRVFFVEELPRNTMGKVQKNVLRESYKNLYAPDGKNGGRKNEGPKNEGRKIGGSN